jgi:hypothetical protein
MMWFILVTGAVAVLIPLGALVRALYRRRYNEITRAIEDAPRRVVSAAMSGEVVRVTGEVRAMELIEAPLTGRPCVYYSVVVLESIEQGEGGTTRAVVEDSAGRDFFIEDGSGHAIVRISGARVAATRNQTRFGSGGGEASERLERFMSAHSHSGRGLASYPVTYLYEESVILDGATVSVRGVAQRREVGATIESTDGEAVLVTDTVH